MYCDFLADSHHIKYIYVLEENSYVHSIVCPPKNKLFISWYQKEKKTVGKMFVYLSKFFLFSPDI